MTARAGNLRVWRAFATMLAFAALPAGAQCGLSRATQVLIDTSYGEIVAEIYTEQAPITAANFLRYVDEGLYRGAAFYRSVRPDNDARSPKITVIQGGIDPTVKHPPHRPIAHESTEATGLKHVDGALFMARWEPGTAASEFAILIGDNPQLDHGGARSGDGQGFAVFGRVTQGMDVVRKINAGPTDAATTIDYMKGQALTRPVAMKITRCASAVRGDAPQASNDQNIALDALGRLSYRTAQTTSLSGQLGAKQSRTETACC